MSRRSIAGKLDLATYDALAGLHRPADPAALRAECRRLHSTGLKPRDIACALRLALGQVLEALHNQPSPASSSLPTRPVHPCSDLPDVAGDLTRDPTPR